MIKRINGLAGFAGARGFKWRKSLCVVCALPDLCLSNHSIDSAGYAGVREAV